MQLHPKIKNWTKTDPMVWVLLQQMAVVTVKFVRMKPVPVLFWAKEQPAKSVAMGAEAGFPSDTPAKVGSPGTTLGRRFLEAHEESRHFSAPRCSFSPNVPFLSEIVVACWCPCTQSRDPSQTAIFASNDVVSLEQPPPPTPCSGLFHHKLNNFLLLAEHFPCITDQFTSM
jgi:hypothetical protein